MPGIGTGVSLALASAVAKTYRNKILKTQQGDLVAYWPLNGNALDRSGHGFNGTTSNVGWSTGMLTGEQCAVFAGNGYINCFSAALAAALTCQELTLIAWCKVSAAGDWTDATARNVFCAYTDVNNSGECAKRTTSNSFTQNYTAGGTGKIQNTTMSPTTWFLVAVAASLSQSLCDMWINTTKAVKGAPGTWAGALTRMVIGAKSTTPGDQPWKGSIEHVALWKTKLSDAQITALSTTTPPFLTVRRPWMVDYSMVGGDDEVGS